MKTIKVGKDNAIFQQIIVLKNNRTKKHKWKIFFVEGVQNIKDALSNDWEIEAFIYSEEIKLSSRAKSILNKADYNYVLTQGLMNKLDVSEILVVIKMKEKYNVKYSSNPIILLIDRLSKKENLGTIIRSADALNVEHIYYFGHSVDVYDHTIITAIMGSFFKMPLTFISSNSEFDNLVKIFKSKYSNFNVVATLLQTNNRSQDYDFCNPVLLLIGNETDGLCRYYNEKTDDAVKIKMRTGIYSLNIACATTACLYGINR